MDFKEIIRDIPDFPQKGILFRDITPVLQTAEYLNAAILAVRDLVEGLDFDLVAGPESRGFIFGVPLAYEMRKGFVPVRKAGKLPYETHRKEYDLEYGTGVIEIHKDSIKKGQRVVVIDDLLATGGTCRALCELIEEAGGKVVAAVFFIELSALKGREALNGRTVLSIVKY
jgi:adenine phosphoribosyltransferase